MVVNEKHSTAQDVVNGQVDAGMRGAVALLVAAVVGGFPLSALAQQIPVASVASASGARLYLELVINSVTTGKLIPVVNDGDRYFVAISDLKDAGLPVATSYEQVDIAHFPRVKAEYDGEKQRLILSVPASWLPQQRIGRDTSFERSKPVAGTGMLVNYDMYTTSTEGENSNTTSVWTEFRGFGNYGTVSNTGVYTQVSGDEADQGSTAAKRSGRYLRYDTTWTYTDDEKALTWELGDYVTRGLSWGGSSRMAGLQLSKDFSLRPDIITYPLPTFYGEASVPSTVDLFINGYRASRSDVDPGPFVLSNIPYINGAGEAVIVTTDALGRQVSTTMPFYVNGNLLREGLSDYSVAVGAMREDYGVKDFAYGDAATTGSYRYGLTNALTMEAHTELASGLSLGGVGAAFSVGSYGDVSLSASHSSSDAASGNEYSYGYRYSNRGFTLAARQTLTDAGYRDLSTYGSDRDASTKKSSQVTGSVSLNGLGSLGAGYFDIETHDDIRTRLMTLTWSRPLIYDSSVYVTLNRDIDADEWGSTAQFMVPLDLMGTATMTFERTKDNKNNQRFNYSKSVPSDGGFGWSAGYGNYEAADNYRRFDLTWRNRYTQLQGGVYGSTQTTYWGTATGSVVMMDDVVYPANRIHDAFVVVSTDGQEGVPVKYENQPVGKTDATGHVLIPWAASHYAGKYEVDPMQLAADIDAPLLEQRVAVRRGSGYLMRFPMKRMVAASVTLVDDKGTFIPVGSYVTASSGQGAYVGWDGMVYLEGLANRNDLVVRIAGGSTCRASFSFEAKQDQIAQIGPVACRN